ncbi:adenylate class-3/4/guanylyl cyclase [Rhizobium sp. KVB221]|uniref:Adenylate class-3/4/guanylyl cyclase n=1 Tax=Rhizobium setariae TaxID=2801340 RepID=A0A937CPJ9_9HYPH|nr:adenylate/guanylate cyclase domain-containing protein [Rhizobium setariae]MBL0372623.1 adenylate class-3/4/guanylyl cyclase [Rhizobium setariae]
MAKRHVERRLAAIMATDVVGYSRLMEADETRTVRSVRHLQSSILGPKVAARGGRIVKLMGDGSLVVFNSVVDAVDCAISLQSRLETRRKNQRVDFPLILRIGINLADVVIEGEDLLGDGVNIAARLEAAAEPGGVCISDLVHRQLNTGRRSDFLDGGEISLKNIAHPLHVWHWRDAPAIRPSAGSLARPTSIAILPFEYLGGSPDQAILSDGITEDVISGLARFRSLTVIDARSSFRFRDKHSDLDEIGRKLGVTYLVVGSLRRAGERIRIVAQLIEAASGMHLWSERYDREVQDMFAIQDEVTQMIVSTLVGQIENADVRQALRKPTTSLVAYEFYLLGLAHIRSYGEDDNQHALTMFSAAIERDPHFGLAHAHLALAKIALNGYANSPSDVLDEALALARKAVALDEGEGGCQRLLALIHVNRREFELAERHYRRAYQINPNDANTLVQMGGLLARRGKLDEAMEWIDEGFRLNPFPPPWYSAALGNALYLVGRYEDAAAALEELPSPGPFTYARLVACYAQVGDTIATERARAQLLELCRNFSTDDFIRRGLLLERPEQLDLFRQGLLKAGLPP